jgi:hypothetical protein
LPAGVEELASAFLLIQELLDVHGKLLRQHRVPPRDDGLIAAKRVFQDLRDGTRGPIWAYIDSVQDSRRPKRKSRDDALHETFQAALIGLVQALEAKFGGSRRNCQEDVAKECERQGLPQMTRDNDMLVKGVELALATIKANTTAGLTGL